MLSTKCLIGDVTLIQVKKISLWHNNILMDSVLYENFKQISCGFLNWCKNGSKFFMKLVKNRATSRISAALPFLNQM